MIYTIKTFGELKEGEDWDLSSGLSDENIKSQVLEALSRDVYELFRYFEDPLNTVIDSIDVVSLNNDGSAVWRVESTRDLTKSEITKLLKEISGQCSDGWGEGFEQHPACIDQGIEYFYSPWKSGSEFAPVVI